MRRYTVHEIDRMRNALMILLMPTWGTMTAQPVAEDQLRTHLYAGTAPEALEAMVTPEAMQIAGPHLRELRNGRAWSRSAAGLPPMED